MEDCAMRTNTLVALIAVAIIGGSSLAMARGGSGGGGGGGWSGMSHGSHGAVNRGHFVGRRFLRNQVFFGDGWGWGWAPYHFVQQSVPRFSRGRRD
jgi:hypothetical protein